MILPFVAYPDLLESTQLTESYFFFVKLLNSTVLKASGTETITNTCFDSNFVWNGFVDVSNLFIRAKSLQEGKNKLYNPQK